MLSSISWSQYITALITLLLFYYCFVGFKYFRWELLGLLGIKKVEEFAQPVSVADFKKQFTASNHQDYLPADNDKEVSNEVQPFVDEITAYFKQVKFAAPAEEILFAVNQIASKYPILHNTEQKLQANKSITELLGHYFPNKFLEEDIQGVLS